MAKKKKNKETTIEDFYDLKTKEMDELVAALKGETPEDAAPVSYNVEECIGTEAAQHGEVKEYSKKKNKEFNPYKLDKLSRIPTWIKALVIKFWFAGLVCYLINFGLSSVITNNENRLIVTGIVLGILVDVLANPAMRYFQSSDREYDNYMMFPFPFKKFWTFFANAIYYVPVLFIVMYMYQGLNMAINAIAGVPAETTNIAVGVEPLLFGVFCVIADMALIGIKDGIVYGVRKAKKKKALTAGDGQEETDEEQATEQSEVHEEAPVSAEALALQAATEEVFGNKEDGEENLEKEEDV